MQGMTNVIYEGSALAALGFQNSKQAKLFLKKEKNQTFFSTF